LTAALKRTSPGLYAAMALMTLLWSMNYYAAKVLTADLPAFPAAGLRSVLGATFISLYYFATRGPAPEPVLFRDGLRFMALGVVGVGFNQYFFVEGMSRTSVPHGALFIALTPALVLVLATIVGQERITRLKIAGLVLATSGIACLQIGADRSGGSSIFGDAIVFCASISFATYTVLSKRLAGRAHGMSVVTYGFIGSALAFVPGLAWTLPRINYASIGNRSWLALLYMSIASSVICYVVYYRALESLPASRVSALSYLQPLVAITTAIPLLGEPITKTIIAGGTLILTGVLLAERG